VTFEESFANPQGNPFFCPKLVRWPNHQNPPHRLKHLPRNHGRASGGRRLAGRATTVPTSFQSDARSVHACRGGRSPRQVGSRACAVSEDGMHARQKDLSGCALSPLFRRSRNLFVGAHMERGRELGGGPARTFLRCRLIFSSVSARRWPHACPARDRSTPLTPKRRGILCACCLPCVLFCRPCHRRECHAAWGHASWGGRANGAAHHSLHACIALCCSNHARSPTAMPPSPLV
jgi:hypothetical protein